MKHYTHDNDILDDFKLQASQATLACASLAAIREKSLANLARWQSQGTWGLVYDEWRHLMEHASDDEIIAIMTGADENAVRLRNSPPYVGLLDEGVREKLVEAMGEARNQFRLPKGR